MLFTILLVAGAAILLGGALVLQVYLSTRDNRWLGFILPAVDVALAFGTAACIPQASGAAAGFLLMLAPLVIHLLLYFACREKLRLRNRAAFHPPEDPSGDAQKDEPASG